MSLSERFFSSVTVTSMAAKHTVMGTRRKKHISVSKAEEWKTPLPFPLPGYRVNLDVMYSVMYSLPIQMYAAFWRPWTQPYKILYLAGAVTVSKRLLCAAPYHLCKDFRDHGPMASLLFAVKCVCWSMLCEMSWWCVDILQVFCGSPSRISSPMPRSTEGRFTHWWTEAKIVPSHSAIHFIFWNHKVGQTSKILQMSMWQSVGC